jgi:hypothetical protein
MLLPFVSTNFKLRGVAGVLQRKVLNASLKMLFFWTNSVSDTILALEVITLVNSTPDTQLLFIRNPQGNYA